MDQEEIPIKLVGRLYQLSMISKLNLHKIAAYIANGKHVTFIAQSSPGANVYDIGRTIWRYSNIFGKLKIRMYILYFKFAFRSWARWDPFYKFEPTLIEKDDAGKLREMLR